MTKYTRLNNDKKVTKTIFTHSMDRKGTIVELLSVSQNWDNVKLLDGQRDNLDQFLVWDNEALEYYIVLGKAGTEFK